jgi:hypothetical protein
MQLGYYQQRLKKGSKNMFWESKFVLKGDPKIHENWFPTNNDSTVLDM